MLVRAGHNLFIACRIGSLDRVKLLVEVENHPVNVRDEWDSTPLYYACLCGHEEVVKYLLEKGARCEENTFDGERCFYAALNHSIKNILKEYKTVSQQRDPFSTFLRNALNNKLLFTDFSFILFSSSFREEVHVHRCILSARSTYFCEAFTTKWKSKATICVSKLISHPNAFKVVLRFLYTQRLEFPFDHITSVLLICKKCKLQNLIDLIERELHLRRLQKRITPVPDDWIITESPNIMPSDKNRSSTNLTQLQIDFARLALSTIPAELRHVTKLSEFFGENDSLTVSPDVCFLVEGQEFYCHKVFFCGRSDYFNILLTGGFSEATSSHEKIHRVSISNISAVEFVVIVEFIYTNSIQGLKDMSFELLFSILRNADMLLLVGLKSLCIMVLCGRIDLANLFDLYSIAQTLGLQKLEDSCIFQIAVYLDKIIEDEELRLQLEELVKESAYSIKNRQATDSIPLIDEIRTHIQQLFENKVTSQVFESYQSDEIVHQDEPVENSEKLTKLLHLEQMLQRLGLARFQA